VKYFTRELWLGMQHPTTGVASVQRWNRNAIAYQRQFNRLRRRLSKRTCLFFDRADVHDGELLYVRVDDGNRPAPLSHKVRPWRVAKPFPVGVALSVLEGDEAYLWTIRYSRVRRVLIDFPTEDPLFHRDGEGLGDWGYHELTDAGDQFLRHEVLFATGSRLLVEARGLTAHRSPGRPTTRKVRAPRRRTNARS